MDIFDEIFGPNYYSMYTDEGNAIVANLVDRARAESWNWPRVYQELVALESKPGTEEATDTEVREAVYFKLGFYKTDEPFYC